ncbi:MAG: aminopeptidase N [Candidatus Microbacterium phytovorans]|uniref:Aminopeptidase N n=1 Tax=Candidatus Microbacterium phytovorans TaxID=3121374 RepID=A0AAJ5W263_9MICO|nr:aminopeptidase N [Microbacterium sp.]WEK14367.1 MAG: aminopeptidase N [Microbacterium sp.]
MSSSSAVTPPPTANLTREETSARSSALRLDTIDVDLDLRHAADLAIETFETSATFVFSASTSETWIDFVGAEVSGLVVNGETRPVEWDGARLRVDGLAAHNVVTVRARGVFSRSGEGLHRFTDPVDDEVYLYTQYEPADARRVYPVFEQPDLKARWRFRVSAPAGWVVLSNGAATHRADVDGGVRHSFAETLPLSSYITVVAAGPYHRVEGVWTAADRRIDLSVLCRASMAPHLDAEEILDVTRRGLTFFEEAFAFAYPWGKYDQIFVPEYNLGAMENPGLVTFTEAYLFRGAATAAQHEARANTILHEMAHMWFGDLATMRWWDDLWLKESFADFMGSHVSVAAGVHPEAWVSFASRRKAWAYEQDQLPTTHPIVADITDLEAAKLNFDGITYAKGASVLKQLVGFVGEDAFFRGAQRYFADHAYGSTTLTDLLRALEAASGRDLTAWSAHWLQTTGMPEIRLTRTENGLVVHQTPARPHRILIGAYDWEGERLVRRAGVSVDLSAEQTTIAAPVLPDAALLVPNDDDVTYAKVRLDERSTVAVAQGLSTVADPLARSVIWAALWNAVRDGLLPVAEYVEIVTTHASEETSVSLLSDVISRTSYALEHYAARADRARLSAAWLATTWEALHRADAGSDAQLAWARGLASGARNDDSRAAGIRDLLRGAATPPDGLALDPDLRWALLIALAATGHADARDADTELAADPSAAGRRAHRTVLGARPDRAVRRAGWDAAWSDTALSNDELDATISGVRAGDHRGFVSDLDDEYFDRIRTVWSTRSIEIARRLVRGLFPAADSLTRVDQWLVDNEDAPAALRRLIIEQRDTLARDLRVRALQPAG